MEHLADAMTDQHTIDFVEGNGIAISANANPDLDLWEVEIGNEQYGLYLTKGDLVAATGEATPGRVPAGADGQALVADSAADTGVAWGTVGGDPATDTQVWMPLVDSDGTVVLDSSGLIPTLIPLA